MNYPANPYHFRQDSTFLYYFGLDKPGFFGILDIDENKDCIFGEDFTIDDIIWMGPQPLVKDLAKTVGVEHCGDLNNLKTTLLSAINKGQSIHFLPPYRSENKNTLKNLLGIEPELLNTYASKELIHHVVKQRSIKSESEVAEIEKALAISAEVYDMILREARPGIYEYQLAGKIYGIVGSHNSQISFPVILSIHGETLHNHCHNNLLKSGDLLIIDSGAESPNYYASDITRTYPVSGAFTPMQRDIYQLVLDTEMSAIEAIKPGAAYKEIHLQAAKKITNGLKDLGLMKGNTEDAVNAGAHALFFPHGLGHMLGLDVHDMEDLGEKYVGYNDEVERSEQFGLAYLRLAKNLLPGNVLTVEPGLYFIPALIDKWHQEKMHPEFINYQKVETYKGFGGIRIEDDVLITNEGKRVLGTPIPKTIHDIEQRMKH
jgi:Xaa-Pro aminopeptidase